MAESGSDLHILATELVKRVNDETRRTRLLEQKVDRFEADLNNIESRIRSHTEDMKARLDSISKGIKAVSDSVMVIETSISRMEKELGKRATKGELKGMESYIELISPITTKFVTREEMDRAIDEKLSKKYQI